MTNRIAWVLLGLFLFLPVAGMVWLRSRVTWPPPFFVDCGTLAPDKAFAEVLGHPMPTGVTDIQCAGIPQSGYVWMRLRATDAAIKSLTGGRKPDGYKVDDGLASLLRWPEPRRVHWEEALLILKPEYYAIRVGPNPSVDTLDVVVDRQRHLVYVERYFQ
jgi:hypothetical protein